jgi:P27 family predicted phage terminase small subunit
MKGRKGTIEPASNALEELPPAPDWFTDEARAEWERTGADLVARRVLTMDSLATFEAYCGAVSDVQRSAKQIAKDGEMVWQKTRKVRHPAFQTKFQALTEMRRLAAELALTPAARSKSGSLQTQGEWDDDLLAD